MADIPRDPRQLARDILAGKISIEELAREQARRAGGGVRPPQQQARVPDRIPLPRPAPVQQPLPRPVVRQIPTVQPVPQRPVPRPPVVVKQPPRRPVPQPTRPVLTVRTPSAPVAPPITAVMPAEAPTVSKAVAPMSGAKLELGRIMRNRAAMRQCIVMAEVLGKPVALREDW